MFNREKNNENIPACSIVLEYSPTFALKQNHHTWRMGYGNPIMGKSSTGDFSLGTRFHCCRTLPGDHTRSTGDGVSGFPRDPREICPKRSRSPMGNSAGE